MFNPGDWITQKELGRFAGRTSEKREFFEFSHNIEMMRGDSSVEGWGAAYPIIPGEVPLIDREKRPHQTCLKYWRLATLEEKAEVVAKTLQGKKRSNPLFDAVYDYDLDEIAKHYNLVRGSEESEEQLRQRILGMIKNHGYAHR